MPCRRYGIVLIVIQPTGPAGAEGAPREKGGQEVCDMEPVTIDVRGSGSVQGADQAHLLTRRCSDEEKNPWLLHRSTRLRSKRCSKTARGKPKLNVLTRSTGLALNGVSSSRPKGRG